MHALKILRIKKKSNGKEILILLKILFKKKEFKESNVSGAILYLKGETQPFSGSVERNSSHRLSRDKYQDGLLEGISIRKSVDGSWLKQITKPVNFMVK